ncbi:MAG TPA: hypothetical protein VMP03_16355 [Methylomirabilota bacterium]|nr:hypothetical protein [Methylomirabilota bacterium]
MKAIIAAIAVAAVTIPTLAQAETYWDPRESEFATLPDNANPANAVAAAADAGRYTETLNIWDPVEGEFASVKVAPFNGASSAIATNDPVATKRVWDPAESEFMTVPAN